MIPTLAELRNAGLLRPIDHHLARSLAELSDGAHLLDKADPVLAAVAMCSAYLGQGHVCLPIAELAGTPIPMNEELGPLFERCWPDLESWCEHLSNSPLTQGDASPLVLDGKERLYLRRYWQHERRLAESLLERARSGPLPVDEELAAEGLDRLFGPEDPEHPDGQRRAAAMALGQPFAVISGGPGTGKTSTVVKLLALWLEQELRAGREQARILLMAPTGKAAARLVESIQSAKQRIDCKSEVRALIPETASTIHRGLGSMGRSSTRFRHNHRRPLAADLVLVDEASMVNVSLMSRLVDALPPTCRLVLLGDKDQLASVEAGAVLGDICGGDDDATSSSPIAASVTHLTKSYRYREGSGIEALALAINAGDADRALEVLTSSDYPDLRFVEGAIQRRLPKALIEQCTRGFGPALSASDASERLAKLSGFRVLCAHHQGAASTTMVNEELPRHLAAADLLPGWSSGGPSELYDGRPLMIRRNDYEMCLFNGDVGLLVREDEHYRLVIEGEQGLLRRIPYARLPEHQSVFAMSIHKSQGSEFDDLAVLLPPDASPVLSRELLYTAITRARTSVCVYGTQEILRACALGRTIRHSGLKDALWS